MYGDQQYYVVVGAGNLEHDVVLVVVSGDQQHNVVVVGAGNQEHDRRGED